MGFSMDYDDLVRRLSKILIGYDINGKPIYSGDLKAEGAMAAILSDAIKPSIVQTTAAILLPLISIRYGFFGPFIILAIITFIFFCYNKR